MNITTNTKHSSNEDVASAADKQTVTLLSLVLPQFSGSVEGWLEFRDIFDQLIDKIMSLDDIQKFFYLKSCLKGEAVHIIESNTMKSNNYIQFIEV